MPLTAFLICGSTLGSFRRRATTSALPLRAALCNGVSPFCVGRWSKGKDTYLKGRDRWWDTSVLYDFENSAERPPHSVLRIGIHPRVSKKSARDLNVVVSEMKRGVAILQRRAARHVKLDTLDDALAATLSLTEFLTCGSTLGSCRRRATTSALPLRAA